MKKIITAALLFSALNLSAQVEKSIKVRSDTLHPTLLELSNRKSHNQNGDIGTGNIHGNGGAPN